MCVTAVIAGASLLLSAVGTYATIQSNNAQKDYLRYQQKEQTKQLKADTEMARIASMERENERAREFNRTWSSSLAAIGAMGIAEHISFFSGIAPASFANFNQDIRAIRLGMAATSESNVRKIGVLAAQTRVGIHQANTANIGAVVGFMQDAMAAASFYNNNKTPSKGGGGGDSSFTYERVMGF